MEEYIQRIADALRSKDAAEKVIAYEELCGGKPDAIAVLARTVREVGIVGRIRTGGYSEADVDQYKNVGGSHGSVIATTELGTYFSDATLITNSTVDRGGGLVDKHAEVMAEELRRRGIAPERIIEQKKSSSTLTELLELIKLITGKGWRRVVVVLNEFHLPRAKAMLEHIDSVQPDHPYRKHEGISEAVEAYKKMKDVHITFVAAEEVLSIIDPRYARVIDEARQTDHWKRTVDIEQNAVKQIEEGTYGVQKK